VASEQRARIERLIPHREPFLFVDRIVELTAGRIVTEWDVHAELPALRGHYPGRPILPGVLASEFCFQSAALLFASEGGDAPPADRRGALPVLTRIENARFKQLVGPGETLRAELSVSDALDNVRWLDAQVSSAGKTVLRLRFAVALVVPSAAATEGA